ncbi:hypothetical protein BYT27DRAFT_7339505 [Phlegmacium glaucopus]|nr:hypothetical protein BYT27DRAFT_7339505 [Phlegmacium glaucopus]
MISLFVMALISVYTIEDLWEKFGDDKMPIRDQAKRWGARILSCRSLSLWPLSKYGPFLALNHTGPGDAQMSSLFQANLEGNDFAKNPREVAYGSKLTLKNMGWGGGLLHSHVQTYPVGSNLQQVTCYHYKDDNKFTILPRWDEPPYNPNNAMRFLKNGDVIRLNHVPTTRTLHSHTVLAPIEVVDDINRGTNIDRIHSLTTRLRIKHEALGCYLRAANAVLPQWGFEQIEVSCDKENNPKDAHTYWNVEILAGDHKLYNSPFLRDFWHLNVAMMTSNNALVPNPDKEDILASKPFDWPPLHLVVWWASTLSLFVAFATLGVYLLRYQRKYIDMDTREWDHFLYVGKIAFYGAFLDHGTRNISSPLSTNAILLRPDAITRPESFHFFFKAMYKENKEHSIRRADVHHHLHLLVVKGAVFAITGPIAEHKGLQWRFVCRVSPLIIIYFSPTQTTFMKISNTTNVVHNEHVLVMADISFLAAQPRVVTVVAVEEEVVEEPEEAQTLSLNLTDMLDILKASLNQNEAL